MFFFSSPLLQGEMVMISDLCPSLGAQDPKSKSKYMSSLLYLQ